MRDSRWFVGAVTCALVAGACSAKGPLTVQMCTNPAAQLAALLQPYEDLRTRGCETGGRQAAECDRLGYEIERLTVVCPGHMPTLMANAVIAHDRHQSAKSQQFLDQMLAASRNQPDAAVLRAQIAIEEGNLPFAKRLLVEQIALAPSHAGLRETYGAALYLDGQFDAARRELDAARKLGAPAWRVAYHLGLVEEADGNLDAARQRYSEAVAARPDWGLPQARLTAIDSGIGIPGVR